MGIFMPQGDVMRPSNFITRNSSSVKLEFNAVARSGETMRMIPLRDVVWEKYAVYFHTTGQKPSQPAQGYCPHSQGDGYVGMEDVDEGHSFLVRPGRELPSQLGSVTFTSVV